MSALVLVVGALMLAAGGYEMVAGSGNILSERGWSAYIAGAALVAGGGVTLALGLVLRALDQLRVAIARQPMASMPEGPPTEARRVEPAAEAAPGPEPSFDPAPAIPTYPAPIPVALASTAPLIAAPPVEHPGFEEAYAAPLAAVPVAAAVAAAVVPAAREPEPEPPPSTPQHEDWFDASFAALERDMSERHAAPAGHEAPSHETFSHGEAAGPEQTPKIAPAMPATTVEPLAAATSALHHRPDAHAEMHEAEPPEAEPEPQEPEGDHATVSAREETAPPHSPVIGRYESEGTSYVMYADGSIDAQSEAGVYRFASMAELKSFIES